MFKSLRFKYIHLGLGTHNFEVWTWDSGLSIYGLLKLYKSFDCPYNGLILRSLSQQTLRCGGSFQWPKVRLKCDSIWGPESFYACAIKLDQCHFFNLWGINIQTWANSNVHYVGLVKRRLNSQKEKRTSLWIWRPCWPSSSSWRPPVVNF